MNQIAFLQSAFSRRFSSDAVSERYDLTMLTDVVLTSIDPLLERRGQNLVFDAADNPIVVTGDPRMIFALLSAVVLEAAGLSSARADLRIVIDMDESDAVLTVIGANTNHLPGSLIGLDRELLQLAHLSGAELELIWGEHEGPTLVLRFVAKTKGTSH